ncbi:cation transporter [bacterium DOLJORAL78_65_58]|nr:MAG: cation transporter [bacterium DOLJORAL78_65_58]
MMAVIFWATKVAHPGYVSVALLTMYIVLGVAPANVTFGLWTKPVVYLVVGGYLIASAVKNSGLGQRIAYQYILRYVSGYTSIVVGAYVLGFLLSFLIPHPWPRSFLIMSVMIGIIKSSGMSKADGANIGLAVFASSAPVSMILLTGDSLLNTLAIGFSGQDVSWLGWAKYMAVPGFLASVFTLILQLKLYKPRGQFTLDKEEVRQKLQEMGGLKGEEKRCLFWVTLAIIMWATDSLHGINTAWVALMAVIGLSMPVIGGVLKPPNWNDVPLATLLFLTAALAIGTVGGHTGMNSWLADVLLPSTVPSNVFMFAAIVTVVGVAVHMVLGSVLAVMGIVIPTIITFTSASGMNPLVPSLLVYTILAMHYVLPIHHMNLLVGLGADQGMYSDKEVIRLGLPLTIVVFVITVGVEMVWWRATGLL